MASLGATETAPLRKLIRASPSIALAPKANDPDELGVPLIAPAGVNTSPGGRAPENAHAMTLPIPLAVSRTLYGTPTSATGSRPAIVIVNCRSVDAAEHHGLFDGSSFIETQNDQLPMRVGVPVTSPVGSRVRPGGRSPESTRTMYGGSHPAPPVPGAGAVN